MKESVYKSAMSRVKTSEDFQEETYRKLMEQAERSRPSAPHTNSNKGRLNMNTTTKKKAIGWTIGLAASVALTVGLLATNLNGGSTKTADPSAIPTPTQSAVATQPAETASQPSETPTQPTGQTTRPPVTGKVQVNIDGVISEVSADGKSFKVGDLWVTVTPDTIMGIDGPTAGEPSEDLLAKEFKVGNVVSGFTSEDVSTGKVNATRIYNNMVPQQ